MTKALFAAMPSGRRQTLAQMRRRFETAWYDFEMARAENLVETDSLNRRRRDRRQATGRSITLQERDLIWLQKLHEHGPLSSGFLHRFTAHLARSEKRAKDRLTDLYHEDRTPHRGPYLDRPLQQFQTLDARYQPLVYDLAPAGERALKDAGLISKYAGPPTGPWQHKFMVATITASIELAAMSDPRVNFIAQRAILDRAGKPLRCDVPFEDPTSRSQPKRVVKSSLIPDAIIGLEYLVGDQKSYRFYVVEADRATEPTRASKFNRKSHWRNFLQYREYIGHGLYKEHLGLTAGLLVLNVTSSERTRASMLKLWSELSPKGNSYQLMQHVPEFEGVFKPALEPLSALLKDDWERSGQLSMRIDRP